MKKTFVLCLLSIVLYPLSANVVEGVAAIPDGYYDGVSGKKGADNILDALCTCISKDYNTINYKALESHYLNTDFYSDTLWDMYSTCRFTYADANKPQSAVCDGWNKEHVCCQSWLGSGSMVSDMFNVYPTDARVNNLRSNYPYGVVGTNKGISEDPEHHALGKLGTSTTSGVGTVYEPDDRYKGDFARTFFYMAARYRNNILNDDANGAKMFTSDKTNLTAYSLSFLLDWHRNDPVSEKEIDRNQGVYGEQNNRNPFIDYPELVEYIWGNKIGQTVDLAALTPTCEDNSIQAPKHGVTWTVNGEEMKVDSIKENKRPEVLPDEPASCDLESESFVGWTDLPFSGIFDAAPAVLLTLPADFPFVTKDVAYHAVFAHAETETSGNVAITETLDFVDKYTNGQEVTEVTQNDVTVTFGKGTAGSNVPKYYDGGSAIRCYPKNTITVSGTNITQIVFTFGSGDNSNAITADKGTFNGTTWTGSADQVVFTIDGSSEHRRIAGLAVTLNGQTTVTTFSRFITTCQTATDIDQEIVNRQSSNRKVLKDGQLVILKNGAMYTILGQRIE